MKERFQKTVDEKTLPQETGSIRQKLERAQEIPYEDVTLEELKQDWLKASSDAGKHNASPESKEKARAAKQKYFEVLKKENLKGGAK